MTLQTEQSMRSGEDAGAFGARGPARERLRRASTRGTSRAQEPALVVMAENAADAPRGRFRREGGVA